MLDFIFSMIVGMFPDVLFFTLFITYAKDIKENKKMLLFLIMLAYILCIMVKRYQYGYYVAMIGLVFIILNILYKNKIKLVDLLLITIGETYIMIISFISFQLFDNNEDYYYLALIVNKFVILLPLLLRKKLNKIYIKCIYAWNNNTFLGMQLETTTIRNITIMGICLFVIALVKYIFSIVEKI